MKTMKKLAAAFFVFALLAGVQLYSASASEFDKQSTIVANGQTLTAFPYEINKTTLVPARAVSDALGFKIDWNQTAQTATITGDAMQMTVKVGQDSYMATSTIAIGTTAPAELGAAPLLINDSLYVPAEIFRIIQGNDPQAVQQLDHQIIINKVK